MKPQPLTHYKLTSSNHLFLNAVVKSAGASRIPPNSRWGLMDSTGNETAVVPTIVVLAQFPTRFVNPRPTCFVRTHTQHVLRAPYEHVFMSPQRELGGALAPAHPPTHVGGSRDMTLGGSRNTTLEAPRNAHDTIPKRPPSIDSPSRQPANQ